MFERYTEKARRVIFFARYEASQFGSPYIQTEHLLLGFLRENLYLLNRYLDQKTNVEEIRKAIASTTHQGTKTSTSLDLPLSNECKRILAYSAEEADRLAHKHIGTEHLLLGILREQNCFAAQLLRQRGLQIDKVRMSVFAAEKEGATDTAMVGEPGGVSQRRRPSEVHVFDAANSDLLLTYKNLTMIPRIGETILIQETGGADQPYLVQDVVWLFKPDNGGSLEDVRVMVVKEDSGAVDAH